MRTAKHLPKVFSLVPPWLRHASFAHATVRRRGKQFNILLLFIFILLYTLFTGGWSGADAGLVVIGNASLGTIEQLDKSILGRIYTGRTVQVDNTPVQPVNMKSGDDSRTIFLRETLKQKDSEYVAYWIVRRAIGKGAPPVEMQSAQEMIEHIRSTPGAIGYIDESQLLPGIKVLLTFP